MIGMQRLTSLQHCVEAVLAEDVPGDLIECGVWRGGACILMRAVLAAYEDETRNVWLAIRSRACHARIPRITKQIKGSGRSSLRASWEFQKQRSKRLRTLRTAGRSGSLSSWLVQGHAAGRAD